MRTGIANLPLHFGSAPRWLFSRMKRLAREMTRAIIYEYGAEEFLIRLADPYWFQAFGCILGFDWHSSGVTTTVGGALKEGIKGLEKELGLFVAGGKGNTSRKTPQEIENWGDKLALTNTPNLIYASKMSAKVDNTAVQDGFQLYHHNFIFTPEGSWAVIQQGMNPQLQSARRYHWLSIKSDNSQTQNLLYPKKLKSFVEEPHAAICSEKKARTLNLVAKNSRETRDVSVELIQGNFKSLIKDLKKIETLNLPSHHQVDLTSFEAKRLAKILAWAKSQDPQNFEKLLGIKGVGPKTILALALIAELIYGTKPSWQDPARYSFAHGGKDGHPYPVDRERYDQSIEVLKRALKKAKIDRSERLEGLDSLKLLEK